jgi:hypothetical protein
MNTSMSIAARGYVGKAMLIDKCELLWGGVIEDTIKDVPRASK